MVVVGSVVVVVGLVVVVVVVVVVGCGGVWVGGSGGIGGGSSVSVSLICEEDDVDLLVVVEISEVSLLIGGGGSNDDGVENVEAGRDVAVGFNVKSGVAASCCCAPATIAAVVANTVATAMPDAASITRRFGRASGSSGNIGSMGAPLVGSSGGLRRMPQNTRSHHESGGSYRRPGWPW